MTNQETNQVTKVTSLLVEHVECKSLRAENITVASPGGTITIAAYNDGVGIWLTRTGSKEMVSIYHLPNQGPVVGVGTPDDGYEVALSSNKEGSIQLTKGKEVTHLTFDEVKRLQ